ncbi:MAG: TPM domain-containing protein [Sphingomonas sp.]|uniref:TPM domain-containing protein n=1 Tax=Sphingomonas sp. TaxID=28214 RepID=UPI003F806063
MTAFRALLTMLALLLVPQPAVAQSFPPLSGRVVDAANLLSPAQEQQLDALSVDVGKVAQRQFVVATIPDLQGYPIDDYGFRLGRAWGIGQKDANNGIILIVAPKEHQVEIEVGYGLEPIMTDTLSKLIIDEQILPKFRAGDMPGGIVAGAQAIAEQMKAPPEAAEARVKAAAVEAPQRASASSSSSDGFVAIFWIVIILFIVLPIVFRRAGGRRYRGGRGPVVLWGPGLGGGWGGGGGSSWSGGSGWSSGGGDWGGGGGGFSGGGGSFGGGGASGSW